MFKLILLSVLVSTSLWASEPEPIWSCTEGDVSYDISWDEVDLNNDNKVYVNMVGKRFKSGVFADVVGITDWSPDIVFYNPKYQTRVLLLLDATGPEYEMYDYRSGEAGELITKLKCKNHYE